MRERDLPQLWVALSVTIMYNGNIMTSKDVQELLKISKNTLLGLERDLTIEPDFRIGNRKRYYRKSIEKSIKKMEA